MNEKVLTEIRLIAESLNRIVNLLEEGESGEILEVEPEKEIKEKEVSKLLRDLGIPANIRGYHYIRTAICLASKDPEILHFITKDLYPAIAKEYETTANRVERAIRHAIEKSMTQGYEKMLEEIFSYSYSSKKGKPTNAEYIATLVDYLNIKN